MFIDRAARVSRQFRTVRAWCCVDRKTIALSSIFLLFTLLAYFFNQEKGLFVWKNITNVETPSHVKIQCSEMLPPSGRIRNQLRKEKKTKREEFRRARVLIEDNQMSVAWLIARARSPNNYKKPNKKETTHTKVNSFVFLHEASPCDLWLQTFCRHKHTMPHKIVGVCIFTCPFTSSWLVYECHLFVESVTAAAKKSNTTRNTCLDSGPRDFPSRNRN